MRSAAPSMLDDVKDKPIAATETLPTLARSAKIVQNQIAIGEEAAMRREREILFELYAIDRIKEKYIDASEKIKTTSSNIAPYLQRLTFTAALMPSLIRHFEKMILRPLSRMYGRKSQTFTLEEGRQHIMSDILGFLQDIASAQSDQLQEEIKKKNKLSPPRRTMPDHVDILAKRERERKDRIQNKGRVIVKPPQLQQEVDAITAQLEKLFKYWLTTEASKDTPEYGVAFDMEGLRIAMLDENDRNGL
eukprot:Platyproteum_vivax@DN12849_c0_g1_i1.p1